MNLTQLFLLSLLGNIVSDISEVGATYPIACAAMFFGAFSLILTMPNFVQSMIGGYGAGVMETMQQMKGGLGMMRGMTIGAVTGGINAIAGRRNDLQDSDRVVSEGRLLEISAVMDHVVVESLGIHSVKKILRKP